LERDLGSNSKKCVLAYWHRPLFSSGFHGNVTETRPLWNDLFAFKADVVLNGHDHLYERFAKQGPKGGLSSDGIREFVVGTGGSSLYDWGRIKKNSEIRNNSARGVLKLTLNPGSYRWTFVPVAGQSFTDTGSTACN
jgi:hypothetical protein